MSSLTAVTVKSPYRVAPAYGSGQYWWHLIRPRSDSVVNMTISDDLCSQIMSQKSDIVTGNGPWAAM